MEMIHLTPFTDAGSQLSVADFDRLALDPNPGKNKRKDERMNLLVDLNNTLIKNDPIIQGLLDTHPKRPLKFSVRLLEHL